MSKFQELLNLFYPELCVGCSETLLSVEEVLCLNCIHKLPIIPIENAEKNEIISRFYGLIPIEKASSFLYFNKHGIVQKLIHELKYRNNQKIGAFLGKWYAEELKEKEFFSDIDYIVPVPLHQKKLKKRGYNQLTEFGKQLSKILNIEYSPNILKCISLGTTQTKKTRFDRFHSKNKTFSLLNNSIYKNKHILLIDDVITTGATLEVCANELLKTENIRISIATLTSVKLE